MNSRHGQLLALLLERGRLSVDELTDRFGISDMTVRRDLQLLEQQGLLMRTHGGCVPQNGQVRELPFQEKEAHNREAKEAIARTVVARLPDDCSLYLDTGTTCATVARMLPGHRHGLRVFSNNLPAVLHLFNADQIEVTVPGGGLGRRSPDLTGGFGLDAIGQLRFDYAITGADAFDLKRAAFYSADLATAALSQTAQKQASQTFFCIDASKFERQGLALSGRLCEGTVLVTDGGKSESESKTLRQTGAQIVFVK